MPRRRGGVRRVVHHRGGRRLVRRLGLLLVLGVALSAGLGASPAGAHAVLLATEPPDGAQLDEPPTVVTATFNEPVTVSPGSLRVFGADGERVDAGVAARGDCPEVVVVPVDGVLGPGTYIASWRVTSADSHPVSGAIVFSVGEGEELDPGVLARLAAAGDDTRWEVLAAVARWLTYAGALLAAGGVLFLLIVHDGRGDASRLRAVVRAAALVAAGGTALGVLLQAALVSGLGLGAFTSTAALGEVLRDRFGLSSGVRLVGLAGIVAGSAAGLARRRAPGVAVVLAGGGALVTVASFALSGHSASTEPRALVVLADLAHTAAGAAWFGGLVLLALALRGLRRDDEPAAAGAVVGRFSTMATVSVVAVAAAGLALAWAEVRSMAALTSTTYGVLLLAKVAIVGGVLALGTYNNRVLAPALRTDPPAQAWPRLGRVVRLEAAGLAVALAVTAVLVTTVPARTAHASGGIFTGTVEVGEVLVDLVLTPNRAGTNEVHVYVRDAATGRITDSVRELHLRFRQPERDLGPIERVASPAGPGHFLHVGGELSIPGDWEIELVARITDFDRPRRTISVTVHR